MSFREIWINFLNRAATGTRLIRTFLTPIGAVIFAAFTALFVVAAKIVDQVLQLPDLLPKGMGLWLSTSVKVFGLAVTVWSAIHFLKVKGTPVPFSPPPKVVSTGPYQFIRNPMLAGVFLILFGLGFAFGSVSLVFLFAPLFVWINVWELKYIEEPELIKRFGDEYTEYRRRTPMFIPRFRPRSKPPA